MKSILVCFAVLFVGGVAWADPIVRWDRIEGNVQHAAENGIEVAGIPSSNRGVTITSGKAVFDLATGFLSFKVEGLSYDRHYPANDRPIGTYPGGLRMATIVCDSTRTPEVVDSECEQELMSPAGPQRGCGCLSGGVGRSSLP